MFTLLLTLHVLAAVAIIGPLIHGGTTAIRGIRAADAAATAASSRMIKIYAVASVIVVALGFGVLPMVPSYSDEPVGEFTQVWVWLSLVLWAVGVALSLGLVAPALDRAVKLIASGGSLTALRGQVAALGGIIGLIFVAITVLMVVRPGQ